MTDLFEMAKKHPIQCVNGDSIQVMGYQGVDPDNCVCFVANGNHFHEFGIADSSVLLACKGAPVFDGDLVVVLTGDSPGVHLYRKPRRGRPPQTSVPTITDVKLVFAKVLGSFNFYQ